MHKSKNVMVSFVYGVKNWNSMVFTNGFIIFSMLFFNLEAQGQGFQLFTDEIMSLTLSGDIRTVLKESYISKLQTNIINKYADKKLFISKINLKKFKNLSKIKKKIIL